MRAAALLAISCLWTPASVLASALEDELRQDWLGAYVVVQLPSRSDCGSLFTNNEVAGGRLVSTGAHSFEAGELGHVTKVDLKRARVDLLIELIEPLLVEWSDGPFTLTDHLPCRIELLFPLERQVVKRQDVAAIDDALGTAVTRYDSESEARAADAYNGRQAEPLPEDHEQTWNAYTRWKISGGIDRAARELERLQRKSRYEDDAEYQLGFVAGLRHYHSLPDECIAAAEATPSYYSGSAPSAYDKDQKRDWNEGYNDGAHVAFFTELLPVLSGCLTSLPP